MDTGLVRYEVSKSPKKGPPVVLEEYVVTGFDPVHGGDQPVTTDSLLVPLTTFSGGRHGRPLYHPWKEGLVDRIPVSLSRRLFTGTLSHKE